MKATAFLKHRFLNDKTDIHISKPEWTFCLDWTCLAVWNSSLIRIQLSTRFVNMATLKNVCGENDWDFKILASIVFHLSHKAACVSDVGSKYCLPHHSIIEMWGHEANRLVKTFRLFETYRDTGCQSDPWGFEHLGDYVFLISMRISDKIQG